MLATFRLAGRLFRPAIGLSDDGSAMELVASVFRLFGDVWIGTIDGAVEAVN